MSGNTPCRFLLMHIVVVVTCNFQPTVSLQTQRCVRDGCKLTCPKSPLYNSCKQICTGGNCNLICHAAEKCQFSCTGGGCKPVLLHRKDVRFVGRALIEAVKWTAKESIAKPVILVIDVF